MSWFTRPRGRQDLRPADESVLPSFQAAHKILAPRYPEGTVLAYDWVKETDGVLSEALVRADDGPWTVVSLKSNG